MTLRSILWVFLFTLWGCGSGQTESELSGWGKPDPFRWYKNLSVDSFDGTTLKAQLMVPNEELFPGQRPAIIFVNSWTMNEYEYTVQAAKFAKKGYITLSYATRGFGGSEGVVAAASPNDIRDVSFLIDWLIEKTNVDPERIGMSGISYGGGISLLALAKEPRLATVASMSSWADLERALYGNDTVRKVWIELLIGSGAETGNLDPYFVELYGNVKDQRNLDEFEDWSRIRSTTNFVDLINKRQAPVFMSNNYNDNLFPPNQMFDFYQKLTGPKKFVVNRGIHATAEISGILGLPNRIWSDVHRWFDYWFMGKQNGILDDGPIAMEHKGELEYFDNLPMTRGLTPVPLNPVNPLVQPNGVRNAADEGVIEIATWWDSGATSGIPLLSPILDAYTPVKVWKKIRRIRQDFGALFVTEPLAEPMTLRGIPQLETWVKVKDPESQFIAYLYDVNRSGWGKLLSHGVISLRDRQVGEVVKIDLDLNTLATDVETGHRVALVVDGSDPLYDNAPARTKYFDMNHQGDQKTRLYLPDMPLPVR